MDQQEITDGGSSPLQLKNAALAGVQALVAALPGVDSSGISIGCVVAHVNRSKILEVMQALKADSRFQCNLLLDLTVVDWMDARSDRYEVVYHLYSIPLEHRIRIKTSVPESSPQIDSIVSLWSGANFMEREAWDMYGVTFAGHPDLRRILMYDEFQGYPLRKDYPVQGKQPRIPLRSPEVRNTALDMNRPALVQIKKRAV